MPRAPGRRILLALALVAPACGTRGSWGGALGTGPTEPARHAAPGWRSWPRANPERFQSKGHGYLWVDVHVAPGHQAAYADDRAPLAPGFRVVMAGYETARGRAPTGLTMIARLASGEWHYAALSPDGRRASSQGEVAACAGCHRHAPRAPVFGLGSDASPRDVLDQAEGVGVRGLDAGAVGGDDAGELDEL